MSTKSRPVGQSAHRHGARCGDGGGRAVAPAGAVVGGEKASLAEYPYAVYLEDDHGTQYCGGTIISRSAIVTAAHCAAAVDAAKVRVVAGWEDRRGETGVFLAV